MLGAAALAVALGIWLIVLAVTPGLRQVLPMRQVAPDVRSGLDRAAAALVLRDRAMEVAGVQSVRVKVSRRKAKAHAVSHFRELDEVRADLDAALGEGLRQLEAGPQARPDRARPAPEEEVSERCAGSAERSTGCCSA